MGQEYDHRRESSRSAGPGSSPGKLVIREVETKFNRFGLDETSKDAEEAKKTGSKPTQGAMPSS
jgi:hypothetical protein